MCEKITTTRNQIQASGAGDVKVYQAIDPPGTCEGIHDKTIHIRWQGTQEAEWVSHFREGGHHYMFHRHILMCTDEQEHPHDLVARKVLAVLAYPKERIH